MLPPFAVMEKPFFEHRDGFPPAQGRFGETLRAYTLGELKWASNLPPLKQGGYIGWDHTAGYLAPMATYRDTHPEFYAQRGGNPIPASTPTLQVGLCTCHSKLEDITIQNALAWIARQPKRRFFGITDGDQGRWNCPVCAASDPIPDYYTDRNLQWVNAVARAIRHRHPDKRVFALAYRGTVKPPLHTGLEPNVMVVYAPWYWTSRVSSAVGLEHPQNVTAMEELMAWNRLFPGQIGVYDYPGDWVYGTAKRLKLYAKHNIRWIYLNGLKNALSRWVASQLLWKPELDADQLVSEFMTASYGPAANTMYTYHALRRDRIERHVSTSAKTLFQDPPYLEQAQRLLSHAVQQGERAEGRVRARIIEAAIDGLHMVIQAEKALRIDANRLRRNFDLYLQWHQRLWENCESLNCSKRQWTSHFSAFAKQHRRLQLPKLAITSTSKGDRHRALRQAAKQFEHFLADRPQKASRQTAASSRRQTLTFTQANESQAWRMRSSDKQHAIDLTPQSKRGPHGHLLRGVGATLALSRLPLITRGRLQTQAGRFRLRRDFKPSLNGRGYRYVSLHLHASHAVPISLYVNEKPALRSDIQVYPGEHIIRVDLHNFALQGQSALSELSSLTLDVWPQSLFYPYPETRNVELTLFGVMLDSAPPTPQSLPHTGKVIWLTHYRPNLRHGQGGIGNPAAPKLHVKYTREERFRSFTDHRVLSPMATIVTHPLDAPQNTEAAQRLQRRLKQAYGVELPIRLMRPGAGRLPRENAIYVGAMAALAHDAMGLDELDAVGGQGFVVRARQGSIALAGHGSRGALAAADTYLQHQGVDAQGASTALSSPFLRECYLTERLTPLNAMATQ